jgi:hypothetical protein
MYINIADISDSIKVYDLDTAQQLTLPGGFAVGVNSFSDRRDPFDKECPPPRYFDTAMILKPLPTNKNEILNGLITREDGCLECTD